MGLRQAHDARRASAKAPARTREDAAGARSRAREAGEPGEEAGAGHQEEREERTDGAAADTGKGPRADKTVRIHGHHSCGDLC